MMFWCAMVVGVICAVACRKKSFYQMWAILFNIMVSIYLGIMLTPKIISVIPKEILSQYHHAASVFVVAILVFAFLQTFASAFVISGFRISFPKIFDMLGSPLFGFLAGYFVFGFVFFIICIMPVSQQKFIKKICWPDGVSPSSSPSPAAVRPVTTVCGFVSGASIQVYNNTQKEVDFLVGTKSEQAGEDQTDLSQEEHEPNKI